jgi:hypothetical protein
MSADGRQLFAVLVRANGLYKYKRGNLLNFPVDAEVVAQRIDAGVDETEKSTWELVLTGNPQVKHGPLYRQNHYEAATADKLYFVNAKHASVYELDTWCCQRVDFMPGTNGVVAVLEMRDSARPVIGANSERMRRMHSILTADVSREMVRNLSAANQQNGYDSAAKRRAVDGGYGDPIVNTTFQRPPLPMPSADATFDVRVAHVRRSIHNAGVDVIREFDERVHHWETGAAENDLANWTAQLQGMVTAVVAALVCTTTDERKLGGGGELKLGEMVLARQLQPHHRQLSAKQFTQEAAMAALWDSGTVNEYSGLETGRDVDLTKKQGVLGFLANLKADLDTDNCIDNKDQVRNMLNNAQVEALFMKRATKNRYALTTASEARKKRALDNLACGAPVFSRQAEHAFSQETYRIFREHIDPEDTMTLVAFDHELPGEGLGYTPPILNFGVCGVDSNSEVLVSIGHGVGLMVEATEIAVVFMQHSEWARRQRARAQSKDSTVDKPIRADGIDVDSPAGEFPVSSAALVQNPVALESFVGQVNMTGAALRSGNPYKVLTRPSQDEKAYLERLWWKRPPPQEDTMVPVPGVAGAVIVDDSETQQSERLLTFINCFLEPNDVADFLGRHFMGAVVERANPLEAPIYAKLVNARKQAELRNFAASENFVNLLDPTTANNAHVLLYSAMKQEISESTATGRRMNHLLQPLLCRVHGGQSRSIMQLKGYWGPKSDFFAVEAESCFIVREVVSTLYRSSMRAGHGAHEGTLGEAAFRRGFHHLPELIQMVVSPEKRKTAAGLVVRLIQSVQASNESIKDSGRVHRQKEARAYVDQSRQAYANLLARVHLN